MSHTNVEDALRIISWMFGWIYFFAWTASFFPQSILNIQRRTTQGLLPDFPLLNVFGFGCYTLSTALFLYSSTIREQYALRHPLSPEPTVRFNDLAFGSIGLFMSVVCYSQFWPRLWGWKQDHKAQRRTTRTTLGIIYGGAIALALITAIILIKGQGNDGSHWAWIDLIYGLEYVKLAGTFFKYVPQVIANFRRRSTAGWSIIQQLLDFTGGVLSLMQLIIDSSLQQDWSGLTGNPLKFGLAFISLGFDVIFILQHFILFGPVEESESHPSTSADARRRPGEHQPLLGSV